MLNLEISFDFYTKARLRISNSFFRGLKFQFLRLNIMDIRIWKLFD